MGMSRNDLTLADALELRAAKPSEYVERAKVSMAKHCQAMVDLKRAGAVTFDYGNGLRGQALDAGVATLSSIPGSCSPTSVSCLRVGQGHFDGPACRETPKTWQQQMPPSRKAFPDDDGLQRWLRFAKEKVHYQGLPSRICWLGYGERHVAGDAFNELVRSGQVSAPIVIGRDHLDSGSVASPERETEGMIDGSDAIADWPILNALVNTASGATWVSVHHGGGVGIGGRFTRASW